MNPEPSPNALAEVREKLARAGWTKRDTGEWAWTPLGENRQVLLRHVILEHGLANDALTAATFAAGSRPGPETTRHFWVACLEELSLSGRDDLAWAFAVLMKNAAGNTDHPHGASNAPSYERSNSATPA